MSDVTEPVRVRRLNADQEAARSAVQHAREAVAGMTVYDADDLAEFNRRLLTVTVGWPNRTRDAVLYALLVERFAGVADTPIVDGLDDVVLDRVADEMEG